MSANYLKIVKSNLTCDFFSMDDVNEHTFWNQVLMESQVSS